MTERSNVINYKGISQRPLGMLIDCTQVLEALTAATEEEFLYIGSKLKDFYDRAVSIAELSAAVAYRMSGDEISGAIKGLNLFAERASDYLRQSDGEMKSSIEKLNQVASLIADLQPHLEGLVSISRTLRVLGFSTGIQNAVLKNPDKGFKVLGEDVKGLSQVITEKSGYINFNIGSLNNTVLNSSLKFHSLGSGLQVRAATILKDTMSGLQVLNRRYRSSADATQAVSEGSIRISDSISNVVTSLQFHDITRQQFEISRKAFDDISAKLGDADAGNGAAHEKGRAHFIHDVLVFCAGQSAQLRSARDELVYAVGSVVENLNAMIVNVGVMLKRAGHIASTDGSEAGAFLSEVEKSLSSVTPILSALSESAALRKGLSEEITLVAGAVRDISGIIGEIEEIDDDVELIAFNAAVKAQSKGEEGRPLSVIAESIQRISAETQAHTAGISDMLKFIGSFALEVSGDVSAGELQCRAGVEEMSKGLRDMVSSLQAVNGEVVSVLKDVNKAGLSLSIDIEEVVKKITVHRLVDQVVSEVLSDIDRIASALRASLKDVGEYDHPDGEASFAPEGELQTATGMPSDGRKRSLVGSSGEFGDNVEFF